MQNWAGYTPASIRILIFPENTQLGFPSMAAAAPAWGWAMMVWQSIPACSPESLHPTKTSCRGENRASGCERFEKNVVFAIAKLLIYSRKSMKKWLKFPGIFHWFFDQLPHGVFLLWHGHALLQRATSDLQFFFLLWRSSNAIARPWCFASALGSLGRCQFWQPHCIDSTCVDWNCLISNLFLDNTPFQEWMDVLLRFLLDTGRKT